MSEDFRNYAEAVYALAEEENIETTISEALHTMRGTLDAEEEYKVLLTSPAVPFEERKKLICEAFSGLHEYAVNLVCLLTEKGKLGFLPKIDDEFGKIYDKKHGILRVTAITAVALTDSQREKLSKTLLEKNPESREIVLTNEVDKTIIGGMVLRYAGTQTDASIASSLEALRKNIINAGV